MLFTGLHFLIFLPYQEHFGYLRGLKVAWVGDGNNIVHSFMMGCPKLGMDLRIATPAVGRTLITSFLPHIHYLCHCDKVNGKVMASFR